MKRLFLVGILTTVSACSSDSDSGGECGQRSGTYLTQFTERSGNCGAIPEQLETIDRQPTSIPAPCTGSISYSDDNCRVTSNSTCPEDGIGAGFYSETELVADWNESGSRGTSVAQLVVFDSGDAIVCQSTYDLVATRQ